jgi:hypothetical protein
MTINQVIATIQHANKHQAILHANQHLNAQGYGHAQRNRNVQALLVLH